MIASFNARGWLFRRWRIGPFWGFAVYMNPEDNPTLCVSVTPKAVGVEIGRWAKVFSR